MPPRSTSAEPQPLRVLAAVLEKDGRWLIAKRKEGDRFSGFWEFPGGKLEPGETPRECLARELHEEFGIRARVGRFLARVRFRSPAFSIDLAAYAVSHFSGAFNLHDHEEIRWVAPSRAGRFALTEPDKLLLSELKALAFKRSP